jgi:hypothetical protein
MDSTEDTYDDSFIPSSFEPFDPLFAFDDAGVALDNLAEDTSFPTSWEEEEKGTLYSTPLSWEPPEPKFEALPVVSLNSSVYCAFFASPSVASGVGCSRSDWTFGSGRSPELLEIGE